jgi:hypothetical protein
MTAPDESLIRDPDLRESLEKTARGIGYQSLVGVLIHTQEKRDKARAEEAARADALAALPREQRRRAIFREVIETAQASPDNLRFMPTPLAICGLPYM